MGANRPTFDPFPEYETRHLVVTGIPVHPCEELRCMHPVRCRQAGCVLKGQQVELMDSEGG